MNISYISRAAIACSSVSLLALISAGAIAQDNQSNVGRFAIEEIMVTAQHRSESTQKASVVIEVVSSDDLSRAGVTRPDDLTRLMPGLSIATSTPAPQIYIRGVGDFAATSLNNPAIAVNVDGVYTSRTESMSTDLFDLERIEVLKGPQGTLYGRNASGGAINLITRRPQFGDFSMNADIEYGSLDSVIANVGVNIPVGNTLAVRVAGNLVRRDGYSTADRGDANSEALRVTALWEPSETVSVLVRGSAGHVGGRGPATVIINGPADMDPYEDNTSAVGMAYVDSQVYAGPVPDLRPLVSSPDSIDALQDMSFTKISAQLDVEMPFANLTVIPSYQSSKITASTYPFLEVAFGKAFGDFPASPEESKVTALEARLANESNAMKWVIGGYYYDENQKSQYAVDAGMLQHTGRIADVDTRAYAAFGQVSYSLSDNFRLIGGLRYTSDRREMSNGATYFLSPSFLGTSPANPELPPGPTNPLVPDFFFGDGPDDVLLVETYSGKKTFKNTSWKAGMEFDLNEDAMLFATASSGFKAGGFNSQQRLGAPVGTDEASTFLPEKLISYDIGLKSQLMDDRLRINASLFYWDYQNQHVPRFAIGNAGNLGVVFDNAQKARMYGGNVDFLAKLPNGGTFNLSFEYNDAKYDTFIYETAQLLPGATGCAAAPKQPIFIGPSGPVMLIDCSDKPLPRAPKWIGSVGYGHEFDLNNGGVLTFAADMNFASARELTGDYVATSRVSGYALANTSLTYTAPENTFTVMAFVRNLTDEVMYNGASQPNYAPGVMIGSIGMPRTYGLRLGVNF